MSYMDTGVAYCIDHDVYYVLGTGCASCEEAVPLPDSYPDTPTLSPEAQAVLDRANAWMTGKEKLFGASHWFDAPGISLPTRLLAESVRAYRATLSPRDYAPDELEPGQRFTFAVGGAEGAMVQMFGHTWRYWLDTSGYLHKFQEGQRLIPLPEQDGSDRFTTTPDQERDTKW